LWFKRAQSGKGTGRGTGQAGTGAGPGQAGVGASSNHDLTPQAAVLTPLAAYWLLLRRAPEAGDVEHAQHTLRDQGQTTLLEALTSSTEFRLRYREWQSGREEDWHAGPFHDALARLGDNRTYVNLCYRVLFDREADAEGLAYYVQRLQENASRLSVLQTFVRSSEFADRVARLNPTLGRLPRDVQLCELANPAKWDNPEWHAILQSLVSVPTDQGSMHRKSYEFAQLLFGLERLSALREDARVLSVGAGHECPVYWLANRVRRVYATDLYERVWQSAFGREGDAAVLDDASTFAPFDYRRDHLMFLRMDGSRLAFREGAFDVAYSLSSIEHFGGLEGARRAVGDMARVVKPGGILALATEWCVRGRAGGEVFSPDEVRHIIDHPELQLVQPIDDRVWDRYESEPVDLRVNRFQTPHMLLKDGEAVFTSVMMFLRRG
jgi:SAM-dependent methyltransferase